MTYRERTAAANTRPEAVFREGPEANATGGKPNFRCANSRTPEGARYGLGELPARSALGLEVVDDVQEDLVADGRGEYKPEGRASQGPEAQQPEDSPTFDASTPAPRRVQGAASES